MTPADHAAYIRQLEFQLYKAEHGMGMPYSAEDVAHYRRLIAEAKRSLAGLPAMEDAEHIEETE